MNHLCPVTNGRAEPTARLLQNCSVILAFFSYINDLLYSGKNDSWTLFRQKVKLKALITRKAYHIFCSTTRWQRAVSSRAALRSGLCFFAHELPNEVSRPSV